MKSSSLIWGALCLVSTLMILGTNAAPQKQRPRGRHIKRTRKELRQALKEKRLLTRRSWYGPVTEDDQCTSQGMLDQGLELQTENRPFGLCENVSKKQTNTTIYITNKSPKSLANMYILRH